MTIDKNTLLFDIACRTTLFYNEERHGEEVKLAPNSFRLATKEEFEMHPPQVYLTLEQAIDCLVDGEQIHTFMSLPNILLGADVSRSSLILSLTQSMNDIVIGGPACRSMKHGLVYFNEDNKPVFIEAKEDKIQQYDIIPNF